MWIDFSVWMNILFRKKVIFQRSKNNLQIKELNIAIGFNTLSQFNFNSFWCLMLVQYLPVPIERHQNQNKFHLRCMWIATRLSYTNALSIGKGAIHYVNWVCCCQDENSKQNYSSLFSSSVDFVRLAPNFKRLFDSRSISAIFWLLLLLFFVIYSSLFCLYCNAMI